MDPKETEIYFYILIIALILIFVFALYILSLLRYHNRLKHLHNEKINIEINTLERERIRISADIHDEIGPQLSNIKIRLELLELSNDESHRNRKKTIEIIDHLFQNIRRVSQNLNPVSIRNYGLLETIRKETEEISNINGVQIKLETSCLFIDKISEEKQIHLYRAIQEAIHNAIRHGSPQKIIIRIVDSEIEYFFEIADDGKGFALEAVNNKREGLGLSNIRTRVNLLGGEVYITSKLKKGTSISFNIPKEN